MTRQWVCGKPLQKKHGFALLSERSEKHVKREQIRRRWFACSPDVTVDGIASWLQTNRLERANATTNAVEHWERNAYSAAPEKNPSAAGSQACF